MNQTFGATVQAGLPDWLTAILLTLAALGGLAIFGRAVWDFIFRPRFRETFDNEEKRIQVAAGPAQRVSIRVKNRTLGPTAAETIFIFFPEAFQVTTFGVGGLFMPVTATPKVMAGVQAGTKYIAIGSPQTPLYYNRGQVFQADLDLVIPGTCSGDYEMGVSIWVGRETSRNYNLKLHVK